MTPGYQFAPLTKRVASGFFDFIIIAIVWACFYLFTVNSLTVVWAYDSFNNIIKINETHNLDKREDFPFQYYTTDDLKVMYDAELKYLEDNDAKDESGVLYKDIARKYCIDKTMSCSFEYRIPADDPDKYATNTCNDGENGDGKCTDLEMYVLEIGPSIGDIQLKLVLVTFIEVVVVSLPFLLLVPLILKNGQTLGKRFFRLGVVTVKGQRVKFINLLARYFLYVILEIFVSFFLVYFLPFVLSVIILLMTKSHQMIHDTLSMTVVVDLTKQDTVVTEVAAQLV